MLEFQLVFMMSAFLHIRQFLQNQTKKTFKNTCEIKFHMNYEMHYSLKTDERQREVSLVGTNTILQILDLSSTPLFPLAHMCVCVSKINQILYNTSNEVPQESTSYLQVMRDSQDINSLMRNAYLGVAGDADLLDMAAGESDLLRGDPIPDDEPGVAGRFSFFIFSVQKHSSF